MTRAQPLFVAVYHPRQQRRSLVWAGVTGLLLHAAVLSALAGIEPHTIEPQTSEPAPLKVTLLDAPQLGARRSAGLAGGDGQVVLGAATSESDSSDPGSAGSPIVATQARGSKHRRQQAARASAAARKPRAEAVDPAPPEPKAGLDPDELQKQISLAGQEQPPSDARPDATTTSAAATVPSPVRGGGGIGTGGGATTEGLGEGRGRGLSPGAASGDTTVLAFRDGMTRPKLVSKVDAVWTKEARVNRVEGKILAKCVITTTGRLRDCQIVKGLPLMNQAVLTAMKQWRYEPVMYQGKPVSVRYLVTAVLKLPR